MSTVNIKYGSNYHVERKSDCYLIELYENSFAYSQKVNENSVEKAVVIGSFDERQTLNDGRIVVRYRNEISID